MSAINVSKMSKLVRGGVGYTATCSECGSRKRLNQVHAKHYVSPESVGWVWALICKCGHTCVVDVSAQQSVQADGAESVAPKAECEDCGLPYSEFKLDMTLPDEQWISIHPSGANGLLCARCIVSRASNLKNIVAVRAVLDDGTPRR